MKKIFTKKSLIAAIIAGTLLFGIASFANAQVSNQPWKVLSNIIQPVINSYGLKVPSLGGSGVRCVQVDNNGLFSVAAAACGSGSGGGSKWATSTLDSTAIEPAGALRVQVGTTSPAYTLGVATDAAFGSAYQAYLGDSGLFVGADRCSVTANQQPLLTSDWATGIGCADKAFISQVFDGSGYYVDFINLDSGRAGRIKGNGTTIDLGDASYALSVTATSAFRPVVFNAGNVGVGTTSPYSKLSVAGQVVASHYIGTSTNVSKLSGNLTLGTQTDSGYRLTVDSQSGTLGGARFFGGGRTTYINEDDSFGSGFYTTNGSQITNINDGSGNTTLTGGARLGIGTTQPGSSFDITSTTGVMPFRVSSSTGGSIIEAEENGRVGIGSTTPIATLSVMSTTSDKTSQGVFAVATSTGGGMSMFRILQNGQVRVGTSTPDDITGTLTVVGTRSNTEERHGFFESKSPSTRSEVTFANSGSGSWTNNFVSFMVHGNTYATNNYLGITNAGMAMLLAQGSQITSLALGTYSNTASAPFYLFTNNAIRQTILSSGNVGIGDTTPAALFTVGSGDLFQVISTGHIRGIAGTNALPSISSTGDTNTGITFPGSELLTFITNGTERARFDANGRFGIGTTTPSVILSVSTSTAGSPLLGLLNLASSTNATVFNVNAAGHIVTGGATPTVSSCGTSPSIVGNDTSGTVTVGSGVVTACTITFAATRANTPRVVGVVTGGGLNVAGGYSAKSTTAVTFSFAATIGSGSFDYFIIE